MEHPLLSKYIKLLKAVQTTRDQQKKFFLHKIKKDLEQAKVYEKELDEFVKKELKEIADQKAGVQKLF